MSILSKITGAAARPWLLYGAGALFVALLAALGAQTWRLHERDVAVAKAEQAVAEANARADRANAERERVSRETIQAYRQLEAAFSAHIQEAIRAQAIEKADNERFAALRSERDELRRAIDTYAAGGGAPADDSLAACRDRAATLGVLLVEGVQLQGELAEAASDHAADVRALRDSWPSSPSVNQP